MTTPADLAMEEAERLLNAIHVNDMAEHRRLVTIALSHAEARGMERAAKVVEAEPEMPGPMPEAMGIAFDAVYAVSPAEALRQIVRITKASIAVAIRKEKPHD